MNAELRAAWLQDLRWGEDRDVVAGREHGWAGGTSGWGVHMSPRLLLSLVRWRLRCPGRHVGACGVLLLWQQLAPARVLRPPQN